MDYMLVYQDESLVPIGYTDSDFQLDLESRKSTLGYVFTFGGGAISWRRVKQSNIVDSSMEDVWLSKFLMIMDMVPLVQSSITVVIAERLQFRRNLVFI